MKKYIYLILLFVLIPLRNYAQNISYPLNLLSPFDEDTIETTIPFFTWLTDLTALQNDPRLSQQFILVEKEQNQSKSDAINTNIPLLLLNQYGGDFYHYEVSNPELIRGNTYVWQVNLLYNNMLIQSSDPWQFTIKDEPPFHRQYVLLKSDYDASYFSVNQDTIYLKVKEEYDFDHQDVTLITEDQQHYSLQLQKVIVDPEDIQNGNIDEAFETYFKLDISSLNLNTGLYQIHVKIKGVTYSQNFMLE